MPMLHGVLVRSAFAVALRWIVPPTWNVEVPAIPTESHVIEKWSDTPQMSGFENLPVGCIELGADTYATKSWTPDFAAYATAHSLPREHDPTNIPVVLSKIWIAVPVPAKALLAVAVSRTLRSAWVAVVLALNVSSESAAAG